MERYWFALLEIGRETAARPGAFGWTHHRKKGTHRSGFPSVTVPLSVAVCACGTCC